MSKTKEEINTLKEEVEAVNEKLHKLTDEELSQVSGGTQVGFVPIPCSVGDSDARASFTGQTMTPKASEIPSTLAPDAESSSGPLDLGLKSEYKDNFNMPNQVQWEHFDLER